MFQVMKNKCDQCLFSNGRIVSKERMSQILKTCELEQSEFICHKATLAKQEVCCAGFWDRYRPSNRKLRMAEALKIVRYVDGPTNGEQK